MASIFLSHSSQDNEAAGDLLRRLKLQGYHSLFLNFAPDSGIKAPRDGSASFIATSSSPAP